MKNMVKSMDGVASDILLFLSTDLMTLSQLGRVCRRMGGFLCVMNWGGSRRKWSWPNLR